MLQPDFYFPQGKATRANYRQAWRYILRNHRYMFISVQNNTDAPFFVRYLGHAGVTIPVKKSDDEYITYRLRFPGDYLSAIYYRNELLRDLDDTNGARLIMEDVDETPEGGNTEGGITEGGNTGGSTTEGGNTGGSNTEGGTTEGSSTEGGNTEGGNTEGGTTEGSSEGGNTEVDPTDNPNANTPDANQDDNQGT